MKWLAIIAVVGFCGCTIPKNDPNILTVTSRTIGFDISQDQASGFYHVRFGFISQQFHRVPTKTNELYAPDVYSSISVGQKLMSVQIDEDYATGSNGVNRIDNTNFESPAKLGARRPK